MARKGYVVVHNGYVLVRNWDAMARNGYVVVRNGYVLARNWDAMGRNGRALKMGEPRVKNQESRSKSQEPRVKNQESRAEKQERTVLGIEFPFSFFLKKKKQKFKTNQSVGAQAGAAP